RLVQRFFFSSKRRHTRFSRDWSSDVCSSDLGQKVRGHTLLWHSQNPDWLTKGKFSRKELRNILKEHITKVVGRYRGKIDQWDVRSEERRVGKDCRAGKATPQYREERSVRYYM